MARSRSSWKAKQTKKRDGYTCQRCDKSRRNAEELHAHHTIPLQHGGPDRLDNMTTLCKSCHQAVHYEKSVPNRYVKIPEGYEPKSDSQGFVEECLKLAAQSIVAMGAILLLLGHIARFIVIMVLALHHLLTDDIESLEAELKEEEEEEGPHAVFTVFKCVLEARKVADEKPIQSSAFCSLGAFLSLLLGGSYLMAAPFVILAGACLYTGRVGLEGAEDHLPNEQD